MSKPGGRPQIHQYDEETIHKVAALELKGYTRPEISAELGKPVVYLKNMQGIKRYKDVLTKMRDDVAAPILAKTKSDMLRMAPKAMSALERNLDEGNMDAVKVWLKGVGLDVQEEKAGDTTLNIMFPHMDARGATATHTKDIVIPKEGSNVRRDDDG